MRIGTKLRGRFVTIMVTAMMGLVMMPANAYAQVKGDVNAETEVSTETASEATTEETSEEKVGDDKEEIYGKTDDDLEATDPMDPLTPDGNLSLVDDLGQANGTGKQFITVVTKTGNYFYIIIDRDDEGEGTVHFLNQVDEADIFNLLSEEQQEEYIASIENTEKEEETAAPEPVEETEEPEVKEEKGGNMKGILGIVGILGLVGMGGGYYLMNQSKKKQGAVTPDPDEDYVDEGEDDEYLEFEEGSGDEEEFADSDCDEE